MLSRLGGEWQKGSLLAFVIEYMEEVPGFFVPCFGQIAWSDGW
jgi:hypothetical protein